MAPEMIVQKASTTKVDMWALGIILYQIFTNKLPFESDNYYDTMKLIRENDPAPLPSTISPFIKAIIKNLLSKDPENRLDA
jgi:serine/threonine protein kinase